MNKSATALRNKLRLLSVKERLHLAEQAGVPGSVVLLATSRIVNAEAFLALCKATGTDPVTGEDRPVAIRSICIDWMQFALAVRMKRAAPWKDIRSAAKQAKVSLCTFSRAANGHTLSIASMLKLCAYAGVHPDLYTQPRPPGQQAYRGELRAGQPVSREIEANRLKEKDNVRAAG